MGSEPISESSFTAIVNAPIEKVDLADWLFGLSDAEYQRCSPAHIAAGTTRSEGGKRMSINVEMIGGSIVVQHYVEDIAEKHHIRLISLSDTLFAQWSYKGAGYLGVERKADRRQELRVHQSRPRQCDGGVSCIPRQTRAPLRIGQASPAASL